MFMGMIIAIYQLILLCAGESGYSSEREWLLYYCSKASKSNTNC